MFDFSSNEPKLETRVFQLDMLDGSPELYLLPAGEVNKPYFRALIKRVSKSVGRSGLLTATRVHEDRNYDRELFAAYIVQGWSGVKDSLGHSVSFNKDHCLEFLKALPDYIFDDLRNFAKDVQNFVGLTPETEKN